MSWLVRALSWWPITLYAGWISVATIANIAAFLSKLDWEGGILSEASWTIILIFSAVVINIAVTWTRATKLFSGVAIWALYAIYVRHQSTYQDLALAALTALIVLSISIILQLAYQRKKQVA